jgi:pimeloyl-ACP methyl ester carboxylesterase
VARFLGSALAGAGRLVVAAREELVPLRARQRPAGDHGFGSTKEDYADFALEPALAGRPFLAYDAPGCGQTWCEDLSKISIPFLVKTAQAVLRKLDIEASTSPGTPWAA